MVLLATASTVIASQAMISGAYSVARQCVQLGFIPRMIVRHTSETEEGQIYLPQINTMLLIGVLHPGAVVQKQRRPRLGLWRRCDRHLHLHLHARRPWSTGGSSNGRAPPRSVSSACSWWSMLTFFTSNLLKVPDGGWVPIAVGLMLMAVMTSWKRGRELMFQRWKQDSLPLNSFLARLPASRIIRVPGTAVFLTGNGAYVPERAAPQPQAQQGAARAGLPRHRADGGCARSRQRASAWRLRSWRPRSIA